MYKYVIFGAFYLSLYITDNSWLIKELSTENDRHFLTGFNKIDGMEMRAVQLQNIP